MDLECPYSINLVVVASKLAPTQQVSGRVVAENEGLMVGGRTSTWVTRAYPASPIILPRAVGLVDHRRWYGE